MFSGDSAAAIFVHTRKRHLRIATVTITSLRPRLTDRGSDETGRVRVRSAEPKPGETKQAFSDSRLGVSQPSFIIDTFN